MNDTLSQEEVDALLNAVKSGNVQSDDDAPEDPKVEEIKVTSYNFRKPVVVSGDQLRGFQVIHDSFAKTLQGSLFVHLGKSVDIKLVAIDHITYGEFVLSLFSPTYLTVVSTAPNMGHFVLEMNLSLILTMIDLMLGGDGVTNVPEPRELTEIEQSISEGIMNVVLKELGAAWSSIMDLGFQVDSYESNPEYVQLATPEALALSVTLDIKLGELTGIMNLCYPFTMIQPVLPQVSARLGVRQAGPDSSRDQGISMLDVVKPAPLDVRAVIGESNLTMDQLLSLKVGDIVCLDSRVDSPIQVHFGDRNCYYAELGQKKGKVAVKLLTKKEDPDES